MHNEHKYKVLHYTNSKKNMPSLSTLCGLKLHTKSWKGIRLKNKEDLCKDCLKKHNDITMERKREYERLMYKKKTREPKKQEDALEIEERLNARNVRCSSYESCLNNACFNNKDFSCINCKKNKRNVNGIKNRMDRINMESCNWLHKNK